MTIAEQAKKIQSLESQISQSQSQTQSKSTSIVASPPKKAPPIRSTAPATSSQVVPTDTGNPTIVPSGINLKLVDFGLSQQDIKPLPQDWNGIKVLLNKANAGGILIVDQTSSSQSILCFSISNTDDGSVAQIVCFHIFFFFAASFILARTVCCFVFVVCVLQREIENKENNDDIDDNWSPGAILQEMIELNEEEIDLIKDLRTKGNVDSNVMKDHFILTNNTYTNRLNDVVKSKGHVAWLSGAKKVDIVQIEDWNVSQDELKLKLKNIIAKEQWLCSFDARRMKMKLGIE